MAANSITVSALDIITEAMQEIGALAAGESPSPNDSPDVLRKLQRLIDRFNARRPMIYNVNFSVFTLLPNTQPITIGPGVQFDVNQRPVEIISASLVLSNTSPSQVEIPIHIRNDQWWANQRVKNLTSTLPTDLYYSPDWPNGNLYFWPVPTDVNQVRLESRLVLAQITSYSANFSLPPGYWDAVVYSLAESLCPMFERTASPDLLRMKLDAIKAIQSNNVQSPRGQTGDAGMPGIGARGNFDYVTALPENY